MFLRKCNSILPGITLRKELLGPAGLCQLKGSLLALLSAQQGSDQLHTRGLFFPDKGIFQELQSASTRILAEAAVLALCRSSYNTSFPRVSQNKPPKLEGTAGPFPQCTLMQGEHSPVGFTPATAMTDDAQASLSVTGTDQNHLVERPMSMTDLLLLRGPRAPLRANITSLCPATSSVNKNNAWLI